MICGTVEILKAEAEDPQLRDRFLAHLEREAARLTRLVVALLTLARVQSGIEAPERRRVDLAPLLETVADAVAAPGGRRRPRVRCARALCVETNAELLAHALTNLAANAAKYDPQGEPELRARRAGDAVEIDVLDRGPGVDPDEREHVFERFARGRETGRDGFGLGLAIARDAVAALDGAVVLEPRPGGGTAARVTLPAAQALRTATRRPSSSRSSASPATSVRT